jgi:hypothetical protein
MISMGMPSRKASPIPLIACVSPAAGTTASTPMPSPIPSETRLTASAMKAAPPSWVTSTGWMSSDSRSSSYSSMLCTPGMPNVCRTPSCSSAWRTSQHAVFLMLHLSL